MDGNLKELVNDIYLSQHQVFAHRRPSWSGVVVVLLGSVVVAVVAGMRSTQD
jgi:hypothetical protein